MPRPEWLTVPNAVTSLRLLLVVPFLVFQLTHRSEAALAVFALAAVTDLFDGLLARVLRQASKLGGLLDPVADKVLAFAALASLVYERRIPLWLLALVMIRDGMMIYGALMVKRKHWEIPTSPSRIGKYATFSLTCLVVLALADQSSYAPPELRAYTEAAGLIAAMCVVISTLQYFARFGYLFTVPPRSDRSPPPNKTRA